MVQKDHLTQREIVITCLAYELAYILLAGFTVDQFAERYHLPANRITRGALNQMVKTGKLDVARRLDADGRWRKYYHKLTDQELIDLANIPF